MVLASAVGSTAHAPAPRPVLLANEASTQGLTKQIVSSVNLGISQGWHLHSVPPVMLASTLRVRKALSVIFAQTTSPPHRTLPLVSARKPLSQLATLRSPARVRLGGRWKMGCVCPVRLDSTSL